MSISLTNGVVAAGSYRLLDVCEEFWPVLPDHLRLLPAGGSLPNGSTESLKVTGGSGGHVDLILNATPVFTGVASSPGTPYGTTNITFTGQLASSSGQTVYPALGDTVTRESINGHSVNGTVINSFGNFFGQLQRSFALQRHGKRLALYHHLLLRRQWLVVPEWSDQHRYVANSDSPVPLSVTANNVTRSAGQTNPVLIGVISGLVNNDNITATYSCSATTNSPAGTYPVVPTLVDPNSRLANYSATTNSGTLTIDTIQFGSIIAQWTFETSQPSGSNAAGIAKTNIAAEVGYNAVASCSHTGASVYSSPAGDGTVHSFSSTNWQVGDYYQFTCSTVGASNISLAWDQVSSPTGPAQFGVLASADGTNFVVVGFINVFANGSLSGPASAWTSQIYNSTTHYSLPLPFSPNFANQPMIWIQIQDFATNSASGGGVQSGGTDRIDNFTVMGQPTGPPGTPTIAWTNPAAITYGTALSSIQLNASANVPGTFAYTPINGSILNVGTNILSAVFTPIDTTDYTTATNTVTLVVQPAPTSQIVYQTNYDSMTDGLVTAFPGTPGQDGYYDAGIPGTFSLIESTNAVCGQALQQVSPSTIGTGGQTAVVRQVTPVSLATHPVVTLSVDFFSHSSDLTLTNPYSADIRAQQNGLGDVIRINVGGGNDNAKSVTGVNFTIAEYNGSNNNFEVPTTVGRNLAWDSWHQVTLVEDYSTSNYVSLTVDGQTENLAGIPLPRSFPTNTPTLPVEIDFVNQEIVAVEFPGQATTDTIYWDNLSLTAAPTNQTPTLPIITWLNLAPVQYGTPLGAGQLDAQANVPGSFVYSPAAGNVLNAGTNTLTAVFTPLDTTNYNSVTSSVSLVVQPALLTVTANSTNRPFGHTNPIFTGAFSGVTNGDNITATYTCSATSSSGPGAYSIVPTLVDPNGRLANYSVTNNNGTLTVDAAEFGNIVAQWTFEASQPAGSNEAGVIKSNVFAEIGYNAVASSYHGGSSVYSSPTGDGTAHSFCSTEWNIGDYYQFAFSTVGASNLVLSWDQVSSADGPSQFAVLASTDSVHFTHIGAINVFANGSLSGPTPFWSSQIYTTNTHYSFGLGPAFYNQPTVWIQLESSTDNSPGGGYVLQTGTDSIDNFTVLGQPGVALGAPALIWSNPAAITYGTALGSNQLNAASSVPGTFVYSPPAGAAPGAGTNTLTTVFTPKDTTDYTSVTNTVSLVVQPAPLAVTVNSTNRLYGQPNPVFTGTINGLTNGDNITATYASVATNNSPAGTYPIIPALIDPNNRLTNYLVAVTNGTLTVISNAATITWTNPAPISYGAALGTNQLNASASAGGSFAYSPPSGTVLNSGTNLLSVVFTPSDTNTYSVSTDSVTLVVTRVPLSITANNASRPYGSTNPAFTGSIVGLVNNDNITATYASPATMNSPQGTYSIIPTLVGQSQTNYIVSLTNGTLTVTHGVSLASWTPASITYGTPLGSNQLDAVANTAGVFVYNPTNGTVLNAGTNQLTLVFTPDDTTNYSTVTNAMNLVVAPAPHTVTASKAARAYGHTNPVFTGSIVGVTNGDNLTATFGCIADTNSAPGPYPILPTIVDPNHRLTNYSINVVDGTLTIAAIPTQVFWTTPSSIIYGTALDTTNQLNATATVPGTFAYSPPSGKVLDSGVNILSVTFTPSNSVLYATASTNVTLFVSQAPLYFTADNASRQVGATNQFFTGTTNGVVNGDNITATFTCAATKFSPAGTYPIVPVVNPNNRLTNYTVNLVNGQLTVGIQLRVVSSNDPVMTTPLYLVGQGSALFLSGGTTNGGSAIFSLPTAGGNASNLYSAHNPQQITAQGANLFWIDPNSISSSRGQIFEVPTAANSPPITNYSSPGFQLQAGSGLASDGIQLYAADEIGGSVWRVNPNGTVTGIGGTTRYNGGANTAHLNTLAISQGVIYLADSGQTGVISPQVVSIATNGTTFSTLASGTPLVSPSGIAVGTNVVYISDPSAGNTIWQIPIRGGTPTAFLSGAPFVHIQGLAYVGGTLYVADPGADVVYAAALTTPIPISNVPPNITWTPSPITYGTALDGNQLNASASVNGSSVAGTNYVYTPPVGTVLDAGTNTLTVVFTPDDTLDYATVTDTVSLVVFPAPLTATANNTNRPVGQANPVFTGSISGAVNGDSFTETFSTVASNGSPAGTYPIIPTVVDSGNRLTNYTVTPVNGTLTVGTAVFWSNPTPIIYGTALGSAQLNATADVPGNFVYTPPTNNELNVGTNLLSVVFTPNDLVDYSSLTSSVSLVVIPATLSVSAVNVTRAYGETNPIFTTTILGLQNGDPITATATCTAVTNSLVGSYAIVPSLIDPNQRLTNYTVQLVNGTLTISPLPPATYSQAYTFTTMAGYPGFGSANGANAQFNNPSGVAADAIGNIYVADTFNDTIRKVTPDGVVSTIAGVAGNAGSTNGTGSVAQFNYPYGLAVDAGSNIYVADTYNYTIRLITPAGQVTTIAGVPAFAGNADGPGGSAHFNNPTGVVGDSSGNNVYVTDSGNDVIRHLTRSGNNWTVTTIAGLAGVTNANDGVGTNAQFNNPAGIALDVSGNLYVADTGNALIRKLTPNGTNWIVSTIAGLPGVTNANDGVGTNAQFNSPFGLVADGNGNLYVGDMNNSTIRKLTFNGVNWKVSTIAGSPGSAGDIDATGSAARFSNPSGVTVDRSGNVYVADAKNALIRKITTAEAVSTLAGSVGGPGSADGPGNNARFYLPSGTAVDSSGTIFVADTQNNTIRRISSAGEVSTYAGSAGNYGSADGAGSVAQFASPSGVAVDTSGNVYVADTFNFTSRQINSAQVVSTIAGTPGGFGSADGTTTNAQFAYPSGLATDTNGNIYVADTVNNTIRLVTPAGVVTTIAGMAEIAGTNDGVGTNAQFNSPFSLAVDTSGRIFVADAGNDTIRMITPVGPTWIVSTLVGRPNSAGYTDGSNSIAQFNSPQGIAVDAGGDVFVADSLNFTIRKIVPTGTDWVVSTIGGLPGAQPGSADGTGSAARFYQPEGICVDHLGTLFIGDTQNNTIRRGDFGQYVPAKLTHFLQPIQTGAITVLLAGVTNAQWRFP